MPVKHAATSRVRDDYLDLVREQPLRPIRSEKEHANCIKVLSRLLAAQDSALTVGERDYAEGLTRFIKDYEVQSIPIDFKEGSPLENLRFLMREHRMNTEALGKLLSSQSAASLILNGKRELSKTHIRKLAAHFHVDAGLFL